MKFLDKAKLMPAQKAVWWVPGDEVGSKDSLQRTVGFFHVKGVLQN